MFKFLCTNYWNRIIQILTILIVFHISAVAQRTIPLYPDTIPNSIPGEDEEYTAGKDVAAFKVSRPTLSIYLPNKKNTKKAAVIICPGGGYGSLVINREGHDVAKALRAKGIAAFVLKYRLPSDKTMRDRSIGPLQDAQQALKTIRQNASAYGVDTSKIGIMGFSAGGHLAASAGVRYEPALIPNAEGINLRPDFMILVYPVITMDTAIGHKGSTFNLLGKSPTAEKISYFSHDLHVTKETPPTFITVADNDNMRSSSLLFYIALHTHSVPTELHIYSTGGHGYLKYPPFEEWTSLFLNWMKQSKWID